MYRLIFYIVFLVNGNFIVAQQNLIYNGSFEEYDSCPFQNDLNNGELEKVKGWWKPTGGTSDYFNRCNTGIVGVPNNFWGYQEAFQGDGYVGSGATSWNKSGGYESFEYTQSLLKSPLKQCFEYKFIMYVNLAQYSTHAIKSFGALFTKDTLDINNNFDQKVINKYPQVFNKNGFLSDSINWTKIESTFIATGDEKFITIGYFFPVVTNDTLFIQPAPFGNSLYSYYFIDSVSLFEIGLNVEKCETFDFKIPNIFTPNSDLVNDEIDISDLLFLNPKMQIYNRWGNMIAELDHENPVWDGTSKDISCSDGVYYYILNYETIKGKQTKSGYIQLIK